MRAGSPLPAEGRAPTPRHVDHSNRDEGGDDAPDDQQEAPIPTAPLEVVVVVVVAGSSASQPIAVEVGVHGHRTL